MLLNIEGRNALNIKIFKLVPNRTWREKAGCFTSRMSKCVCRGHWNKSTHFELKLRAEMQKHRWNQLFLFFPSLKNDLSTSVCTIDHATVTPHIWIECQQNHEPLFQVEYLQMKMSLMMLLCASAFVCVVCVLTKWFSGCVADWGGGVMMSANQWL